jgi:hypothetical protein
MREKVMRVLKDMGAALTLAQNKIAGRLDYPSNNEEDSGQLTSGCTKTVLALDMDRSAASGTRALRLVSAVRRQGWLGGAGRGSTREFALDLLASQGIELELQPPLTEENAPLSLRVRRQLFLMFTTKAAIDGLLGDDFRFRRRDKPLATSATI